MVYDLCQYKDLFGKVGTGFHKTRILGLSIGDLLGTIVIAAIISYISKINFIWSFILLFLVGELLHLIFCVDTAFLNFIGLN